MLDFLNTELFEIFGHYIYPGFIILIFLIVIILLFIIKVIKDKVQAKDEDDVYKDNKEVDMYAFNYEKKKFKEDDSGEEFRPKEDRLYTAPTNDSNLPEDFRFGQIFKPKDKNKKNEKPLYHNKYNTISSWQKEFLNEIFKQIATPQEGFVLDPDYLELIDRLKTYVNERDYWYSKDLLDIDANSIMFLSQTLTEYLSLAVYNRDLNQITLISNLIDRINGNMEKGIDLNNTLHINSNSYTIKATDDKDSRQLTGEVLNSLNFLKDMMPEGKDKLDPNTLNISPTLKIIDSLMIDEAWSDLSRQSDYLDDISKNTRWIIIEALLFHLRFLLQELISGRNRKVTPNISNKLRVLASFSDQMPYSKVVESIA